jgi:hypothetical protein
VFEKWTLKRIFGPKGDEKTGSCRKLYNEEFHNLCSSPSIFRMIKPSRMGWAGHEARMRKRGMQVGYCWEIQKEKGHWTGQDVGGWII